MAKKQEKQFRVIVERDEDGFIVASVPALPGCHVQARTLVELKEKLQDAIVLCLDVARNDASYRTTIRNFAYEPSFIGLETIVI